MTCTASNGVRPARWWLHGVSGRRVGAQVSGDIAPITRRSPSRCRASLHAVERAQITFEDTVVVAGCGPIGLGMVAGAWAKNPMHVIALDMALDKLKLAEGRCRHHDQHRRRMPSRRSRT